MYPIICNSTQVYTEKKRVGSRQPFIIILLSDLAIERFMNPGLITGIYVSIINIGFFFNNSVNLFETSTALTFI